MSSFKAKVFDVVRKIPSGKTLTYKQVAEKAGCSKAYRAVGNVLHSNYTKNIPCHRVIRSDGKFGGYNRGIDNKKYILHQEFFGQPALKVAKNLLGKYLIRQIGNRRIKCLITEVEAYVGPHDKACHAHKGFTPRTKIMFGPPGFWYVYFTYGMHWLLNIVTSKDGYPAAVLIRGTDKISGPARLTKFLAVDIKFNGKPILPESGLWIENSGIKLKPRQIKRTPRIGVSYAEEWAEKPYRFLI